jgi:hypothetical protein
MVSQTALGRARRLCEHLFVTAQDSAYTRLRRALDRGNLIEALSSASELEHVGLTEALELCLLLVEKFPSASGGRPFAGTAATAGSCATSTWTRGSPCSPRSARCAVRAPSPPPPPSPSCWAGDVG